MRRSVAALGAAILSIAAGCLAAPPAQASGWTVSLAISGSHEAGVGGAYPLHLVATANQDVGPTPYFIDVVDYNTNQVVLSCGYGAVCDGYANAGAGGIHGYEAFVEPATLSGWQARSGTVTAFWWQATLTATPTRALLPGTPVSLVASTNSNVERLGFELIVREGSRVLARCLSGSSCATTDSILGVGCHTYTAAVTSYDDGPFFATDDESVCWGVL